MAERERPIIFSGPQVKATLDGRKTQHRVVLKPQPNMLNGGKPLNNGRGSYSTENGWKQYPFAVGDVLWVRETWAHYQTVNHIRRPHGGAFDEVSDGMAGYRADGHDTIEDFRTHVRLMSGLDLEAVVINGDRWRYPIHMPRWASRLTLRVTNVRVQRLMEISEEDARAEGCPFSWDGKPYDPPPPDVDSWQGYGRYSFCLLWDTLNAKRGHPWESNPWIVALTFERIADHG